MDDKEVERIGNALKRIGKETNWEDMLDLGKGNIVEWIQRQGQIPSDSEIDNLA